jgi:hypothetical protein
LKALTHYSHTRFHSYLTFMCSYTCAILQRFAPGGIGSFGRGGATDAAGGLGQKSRREQSLALSLGESHIDVNLPSTHRHSQAASTASGSDSKSARTKALMTSS